MAESGTDGRGKLLREDTFARPRVFYTILSVREV
jgi:hypothetical protein